MRKPHLALVTAAGLLLALGVSAEAAGKGGGLPPGFSSPGGHGGFEQFNGTTTTGTTTTPTTKSLPPGWDEGGADWKGNLQSPSPPGPNFSNPFAPPGLSR